MAKTYRDLPRSITLPLYGVVGLTLAFLVLPLVLALPMSVSSDPWFTYPLPGYSLRWFEVLATDPQWRQAIVNSLLIAVCATVLATGLGTAAAVGLVAPSFPARSLALTLTLAPLIVPMVVSALGFYLFFSRIGLLYSFWGIVIAHAVLATPFVVITVTATLTRFDFTLVRAAKSLGASKLMVFRTVMLPIIAPGVAAGALFAFITSFDEVVVALFLAGPEQRTLPRQLFSGMREQLEPTIIAAAVVVICISALLMAAVNRLRSSR